MDYSGLSDSPLFKGLTAADIEAVLAMVPFKVKKFRKGVLISQSGEPVNSLIIILSGVVKGEMVDYAGRVIKIEDIPAPGALASAFMFGSNNRFPVNVIAVSDGELLLIEKSDFLNLLVKNNKILINFLDMISNRSQFLSGKIKFLNFRTIKGKMAYYLLQKAGRDLSRVTLDMTQNELADFFGVTRPSIGRALGELESEGLIEAKGKKIKIIDKEGLADLIVD
jgi:CRP/FNR family transcriptional regulator, dissimilatory nitrate respiration regulator